MAYLKRKTSIIFYQISLIGLFFLSLFLILNYFLYSKTLFIWSSLMGRLETICGCTSHFSFVNHPFLFTSLIVTSLGAIFFISYAVIKVVNITKSTNKFIHNNLKNKKLNISKKLKIVISKLNLKRKVSEIEIDDPVVFCHGFINSKICISSSFVDQLSEAELMAVLLHEQYHLKAFEPMKLFIVHVITRILFFVPGLTSLSKKYNIFSEMAADEWVVKNIKDKAPLAKAIYKILKWKERSTISSSLTVSFFYNTTEERINKIVNDKYVINFKFFTPKVLFSTFLLTLFILFFSFFLYSSGSVMASHDSGACMLEGGEINQSQGYECETECIHMSMDDGKDSCKE